MLFNTAMFSNDTQPIQCTNNLNEYILIKMCYVWSDIVEFLVKDIVLVYNVTRVLNVP